MNSELFFSFFIEPRTVSLRNGAAHIVSDSPHQTHLIYKLPHGHAQRLVFLVISVPVELTVFTVMVSEWKDTSKPDQPLLTLMSKEHYVKRWKALEASGTKWENRVLY